MFRIRVFALTSSHFFSLSHSFTRLHPHVVWFSLVVADFIFGGKLFDLCFYLSCNRAGIIFGDFAVTSVIDAHFV